MQKEKDQLYILSQELLSTRVPSPSYPVFLFEQFIWFKLKVVKEGRPYEMATSAQFLETFMESGFVEQNVFFELYLHEMACPLLKYLFYMYFFVVPDGPTGRNTCITLYPDAPNRNN